MKHPPILLSENSRSVLVGDGYSSKVPEKFHQFLASFVCTIAAICMGMVITWTSSANPILEKQERITHVEGSWIGSLLTLGAFVGAVPAGNVANLIGRKLVVLLLNVPLFLSWIVIAYLNQYLMALYVARFVSGIVIGAFSVAIPMYVSELAHISIRGTLGTLFQLQITVGLLIEYIIGALITDFKLLALASSILPIIFFIIFWLMPESPVFLCEAGKLKQAKDSLVWFRGTNYNTDEELSNISEQLRQAHENKVQISDLVTNKATFKALIISFGLMVFQQLSGINAVLFYSNQIFEKSGSSMSSSSCSIIIGCVQVLSTLASTILIDKAGRKVLLLISDLIMCFSLAVLGLYLHYSQHHDLSQFAFIPLLNLALFIVFFSIGFGPIPWMIMGELFPANIKGVASSISAALNWLLAFTVTNQFGNLEQSLGIGVTFLIFSLICGIGTIFVSLTVPETKGKSIEEVRNVLMGIKDCKTNFIPGDCCPNETTSV